MAQLRVAPGGEHVLPKEPPQTGGFDFGLAARNARLAAAAGATTRMPEPMSTGTTICGVVYAGGVVLGADTRATGGSVMMCFRIASSRSGCSWWWSPVSCRPHSGWCSTSVRARGAAS